MDRAGDRDSTNDSDRAAAAAGQVKPDFLDMDALKQGDRVGFERQGVVYTGIVKSADTDENGVTTVTFEDIP